MAAKPDQIENKVVDDLLSTLFPRKEPQDESKPNLNIGKLRPKMPLSSTETKINRHKIIDLKLSTPEIFKEKKFINEGTFGKVYRAKIDD